MHGLNGGANAWIALTEKDGFPYILVREDFDVWIPNMRGNCFSRSHLHLNPDKDAAFWDFSW